MAEEVTNVTEIKTSTDGNVKITLEKYNELLEKAKAKPPVYNQTTIIKTPEMVAQEYRMWGGGLMGLGGSLFIIGAALYKAGRSAA